MIDEHVEHMLTHDVVELAASPQEVRSRHRRRPRGTTASSPKSESPLPPTTIAETQVRSSMSGTGDGQPTGQPSAAAGSADVASRSVAGNVATGGPATGTIVARPIYVPQRCRLCDKPTVYLTRSGLSDHATVHHAHWYSARRDEYVPISEAAELEAERQLIKKNQVHCKFRRDPADAPGKAPGRGGSSSAKSRAKGEPKHLGGIRHAPQADKRSAGGTDPPTASMPTSGTHRQRTSSERRVCRVDLSQSQVPPNLPSLVQPTTASMPVLTATSAMLPATAKPLFSVVTVTSSRPSTSDGTALQTPIPVPVAQAAVDTPDVPPATPAATGGGSTDPLSTTSASQVDRRPYFV